MAEERDVKVRISAEDKTSAGLRSADRSIKEFDRGARGLLGTLRDLTVAGAGIRATFQLISRVVISGVKAFEESEEATARLALAFRSQGEGAVESTKRALKFADSLSRVTRFSDETIAEVQALLASLQHLSGEGLERTTRTALDLAEFFRIDAVAAARLISRADDLKNAFARMGVDAEEANKILSGQASIIDGTALELNKAAGASRDFSEALGEMNEGFGQLVTVPLTLVFRVLGGAFREVRALAEDAANFFKFLGREADEARQKIDLFAKFRDVLPKDLGKQRPGETVPGLRPEGVPLPGTFEEIGAMQVALGKQIGETIKFARDAAEEAAPSIERFFGIGRFISDWQEMQALADEQTSVWGRVKSAISGALDTWKKGVEDAAAAEDFAVQQRVTAFQAWNREQKEINRLRGEAAKFQEVSDNLANASALVGSISDSVSIFNGMIEAGVKGTDDLVAAQRRLDDAVAMVREAMSSVSDLTPQQQKAFEGMLAALETRLLAIDRAFEDAGASARTADAAAKAAQAEAKARLAAANALFESRSRELAASIGGPVQSALVDALSGVRKRNFREWAQDLGTEVRRSLATALTKPFFETLFKPIGDILARLVTGAVEGLAEALGIQIEKAVEKAAVEKAVGEVAGTGGKTGGGGGTNVSQTVSTIVLQPVGGIGLQSVTTVSTMVAAVAASIVGSISTGTFLSGLTFIAAGVIPAIVVSGEVGAVIIGAIGAVGAFVAAAAVNLVIIGNVGEIQKFAAQNVLLVNVDLPAQQKGDTIYFQMVGQVGMVGSWLSLFTNANVGMVGIMTVLFGIFAVAFLPAIFFSGLVNAVLIGLIVFTGGLFFMGAVNQVLIGSIGNTGRLVFAGMGNFVQIFALSVREINIENASLIGGGGGGGILGFQHGGSVSEDTLAFLHAGEEVLTADDVKALSRGGGGRIGSMSVTVNAAGGNIEDPAVVRKLSRALGREVERRIRRPGRGR